MELIKYENGILHIKLGEVDYYYMIPQHVYDELSQAENKQQFFMTRIDGIYSYEKRSLMLEGLHKAE